jgi:hypothetical protein
MSVNFKIYTPNCILEDQDQDSCDQNHYAYPTGNLGNGQSVFVCGPSKNSIPLFWPYGNKVYKNIRSTQIPVRNDMAIINKAEDLLFYLIGLEPNKLYEFNFNDILFSSTSDDFGILYLSTDNSQPFPLAALPLVELKIVTEINSKSCSVGVASYTPELKYENFDNSIFLFDSNQVKLDCNYETPLQVGAIVSNEERKIIEQTTYNLSLGEGASKVDVIIKDGTISLA